LYFGAGGGADILGALAFARSAAVDDEWTVAGWLSPLHDHFFHMGDDMVYEAIINRPRRLVRFKRIQRGPRPLRNATSWSSVAQHRPSAVDDLWRSSDVERIYLVSTRGGSGPIVEFLSKYSDIVVIDVGGDILFDGTQKGIKTPVLDAFALACAAASPASKQLVIIGPGMDGELVGMELKAAMEHLPTRITRISHRLAFELLRASRILPQAHSGSSLRGICDRFSLAPAAVRDHRGDVVEANWNKVVEVDFDETFRRNPLAGLPSVAEMYRAWTER
jgi:hypothetical protein